MGDRRLLSLTSAYLLYYWGTALFTPTGTRAHDPLVTAMDRTSATIQSWASNGAGTWLLLGAAGVLAVILLRALWRWARAEPTPDHDPNAKAPNGIRSRS